MKLGDQILKLAEKLYLTYSDKLYPKKHILAFSEQKPVIREAWMEVAAVSLKTILDIKCGY